MRKNKKKKQKQNKNKNETTNKTTTKNTLSVCSSTLPSTKRWNMISSQVMPEQSVIQFHREWWWSFDRFLIRFHFLFIKLFCIVFCFINLSKSYSIFSWRAEYLNRRIRYNMILNKIDILNIY
jgi:hypothetical protein